MIESIRTRAGRLTVCHDVTSKEKILLQSRADINTLHSHYLTKNEAHILMRMLARAIGLPKCVLFQCHMQDEET